MKRFNILLVPNFVNSVAFLSRMSEIVSVDSRLTLSLCSVLTDPLSARWGDDSLLFPYPYRKKIQEILRLKLTVTSSGVYAWSFLLMEILLALKAMSTLVVMTR
ncbi:ribosomal protein S2 [Corchorus olitorius]|uniref:Ribosomal protein S2 n=1 Tax=Corchorus olitorius TaxID=93759 RepID=A0A1R3L0P9_9ROSI|nr:ribosomal protein S2 [Corchorus olitorius]OMP13830.1 ribosomal protein S2 [Corchorus olitorius]